MLEKIAPPGAGCETTRLGFGGSGLMGGLSERESLNLLETAYDAGIRHFDVAPSYGHGQAERCLRKFLLGKADKVTITTKYGILPPSRTGLLDLARGIVRPVVQHLPAVRKQVARAAAGLATKANFSMAEAQRSLDRSLRELAVDRIDVWLLHEATAEDLDHSDLLPFLQRAQQQGRIGVYGVGAERARVEAIWQRHRAYCPLLQFEWSVLDDAPCFPGAFLIHHRAVSGALARIPHIFGSDAAICRRWSDAVDANLSDPEILAAVLLQATLAGSPGSMVLFSSRSPKHIRDNARAVDDAGLAARGRRFLQIVAEEGGLTGKRSC